MKSLSIYITELRANLVWNLAWLGTFIGFLLILIGVYPGEKEMQTFLTLFQTSAYFQDIVGNFGNASPGYTLWISFMIPFDVIILMMYAMTTGVRTAVQSVSEGTGELLHTLPVSRTTFLLTRAISNFTYIIGYFVIQTIMFSLPLTGSANYIKLNNLLSIGWWGVIFCLFSFSLGILVGLLAGNSAKGHQISLILIMFFYIVEVLARVSSDFSSLNNINPLTYYQPDQYLIGRGFVKNVKVFGFTYYYYPVFLLYLSIVILFLSVYEFNRKDLSNDAGVHFNVLKRISLEEHQMLSTKETKIIDVLLSPFSFTKKILFPENVRNNPFVFWARIFEKELPITADFIYSDNILLFIAFLATILFFPFQIAYYPGDAASRALASGGGIFTVFTYGHNLVNSPYLFYLVSNTIGVTWVITVPLTFFWVRKAIRNDGNSGTGEIFGGIALRPRSVVFQRLFAIIIELLFIISIMIVWLIISEAITNETYNKLWEVLSLVGMLPLYIFLITFTIILSLIFKQKGGLLSGIILIGIVISFLVSILNTKLNTWYFRGIFGLYDPISIIQNTSFLANNDGLVYLTIFSLICIVILFFTASKFTWLNIVEKSEAQE